MPSTFAACTFRTRFFSDHPCCRPRAWTLPLCWGGMPRVEVSAPGNGQRGIAAPFLPRGVVQPNVVHPCANEREQERRGGYANPAVGDGARTLIHSQGLEHRAKLLGALHGEIASIEVRRGEAERPRDVARAHVPPWGVGDPVGARRNLPGLEPDRLA